ncbi:MAG: zf-HC2 domain-containing protein [Candidatus Aegiribacteria sp.]|nr:zf-HC2 domain-containing protein [Candidatus Aegiribacteria sp.]
MSSCSRSTSVLSYLLGELNEDDMVLFEKHLESCPICRDELRLERSLQNGLVEFTKPGAAPPELRLNVLKRTLTVQRPRFPFWQIAVTILSGVAAFLVLLQVLSGSSLLETGIGLLIRFIDEILATVERIDSLTLMIGAGIVLVGITSVVASLLPEE